jgi:hypothetical protein
MIQFILGFSLYIVGGLIAVLFIIALIQERMAKKELALAQSKERARSASPPKRR